MDWRKGKANSKSQFSRFILPIFILVLVHFSQKARSQHYSLESEPLDVDNECYQGSTAPVDNDSLQMRSLRRYLLGVLTSPGSNEKLMLPNYDLLSDGKIMYDAPLYSGKRSLSSAEVFHVPYLKRNIGAFMNSQAYHYVLKKSLATLAKNGQLPTLQSPEESAEEEEEKRGIESLARGGGIHQFIKKSIEALARNGELYSQGKNNYENYKRNIQYVMKNGGLSEGKRNIVSLIRTHNMPDRNDGNKRNIGTIARDWALPNHSAGWNKNSEQKRNVAAMLRQDSYLHSMNRNSAADVYPTPESDDENQSESKRNLASIKSAGKYGKRDIKRSISTNDGAEESNNMGTKSSSRRKREADEYFTENSEDYNPILHKSNGFDYDDLVRSLSDDYLINQKRFLGNIPLSRMTELGKISLMGQTAMSNATPTSPTYRRRQYLLSRTKPEEEE